MEGPLAATRGNLNTSPEGPWGEARSFPLKTGYFFLAGSELSRSTLSDLSGEQAKLHNAPARSRIPQNALPKLPQADLLHP